MAKNLRFQNPAQEIAVKVVEMREFFPEVIIRTLLFRATAVSSGMYNHCLLAWAVDCPHSSPVLSNFLNAQPLGCPNPDSRWT
jgi:hypothetical protein